MDTEKASKAFGYDDITNKMRDFLLIECDIVYQVFKKAKTLDKRSSEVIVLLGSSCQTASAIAKLSEHPDVFLGECYILARAFIEKIINYCYLLVCDDDEHSRFIKHTIQKSHRKLDRKIIVGENELGLKHSAIPDYNANSILKDSISEFTSKSGKEITRWTIKRLEDRIDTIQKNSKLKPIIFMMNVFSIYEDASEAVHGTLYGCSFQGGFYNPNFDHTNPVEVNKSIQKYTAMLLWNLVLLFHQAILLISEKNNIDDYLKASTLNEETTYKVMESARAQEKGSGESLSHESWGVHYKDK